MDNNKTDVMSLPLVATPYGVIRFWPHGQHSDADRWRGYNYGLPQGLPGQVNIAIPIEDGGLNLPNGNVYVTAPGTDITLVTFGGVNVAMGVGKEFPVKPVVGAKLGKYIHTYDEDAEAINEILFQELVKGSFGFMPDVALATEAFDISQKKRAYMREAIALEAKVNQDLKDSSTAFGQHFEQVNGFLPHNLVREYGLKVDF